MNRLIPGSRRPSVTPPPLPPSRRGITGGPGAGLVDLRETLALSPEAIASRFPKADAVLDAARIADALRSFSRAIDELAGAAYQYDVGTLRRKLRAVRVHAAEALLEIDGQVDHLISTGGTK